MILGIEGGKQLVLNFMTITESTRLEKAFEIKSKQIQAS